MSRKREICSLIVLLVLALTFCILGYREKAEDWTDGYLTILAGLVLFMCALCFPICKEVLWSRVARWMEKVAEK